MNPVGAEDCERIYEKLIILYLYEQEIKAVPEEATIVNVTVRL